MAGNDYVTIDCDVKHDTDSAFLIDTGDEEIWIPKSQCAGGERGDTSLEIREWLALEKGLI